MTCGESATVLTTGPAGGLSRRSAAVYVNTRHSLIAPMVFASGNLGISLVPR
jgi:hypothetical protein